MRKFAASLYGVFPAGGINLARITDRSENPRWAKLEREVIGKYLDAYAHQWSKVDKFHSDKDNISHFGRKYGDVYGDLGRQYQRHRDKPSRRQVLKALASGGGSDQTPRYPGAKYGRKTAASARLRTTSAIAGSRSMRWIECMGTSRSN